MKRFVILALILGGFAALCLGQRRPRVSPVKVIQLSEPKSTGSVSFEEALAKRRSVRQFTGQPLKLAQIGQLAWAGQGITEPARGLRTAPSAGAIYPITLYFATQDGLFVYNAGEHSLEQTSNLDVRGSLAATNAPCNILIAGSERKLAAKFRGEANKYMLLEAGHIAQNIQLQAVCLGLGSVSIGGFDARGINRVCKLSRNIEPLYIISVGYPAAPTTTEEKTSTTERPKTKRAVLIIARENFRDEELFETRRVLTEAGVNTVVASSKRGAAKGMLGRVAEAAILVNEIAVDDYDAIIFVGGAGAMEYFHSRAAWNIAREAVAKRKVLGAICIAPAVLANAGVLTGVRATSFPSERERLQRAGALYTGVPVERDGLIITGSGPMAAIQFGRAIADALAGR
ncbi:MAG TPA: DJ-1/PfpI family protein [Sedimentisphaerales bacterium]|nr:DJ-1/PfpI family protein [Sedimentisphaerales bacterium]